MIKEIAPIKCIDCGLALPLEINKNAKYCVDCKKKRANEKSKEIQNRKREIKQLSDEAIINTAKSFAWCKSTETLKRKTAVKLGFSPNDKYFDERFYRVHNKIGKEFIDEGDYSDLVQVGSVKSVIPATPPTIFDKLDNGGDGEQLRLYEKGDKDFEEHKKKIAKKNQL